MKKILCILLLIPFVSIGQNTEKPDSTNEAGIKFEHGQTWTGILARAKAENRYIFVDCYATWCGPCKFMSRVIFSKKEVANYFNTHFISVAIQMDQTAKDSQEVKNWYAVATEVAKEYGIGAYPTYLFFSPQGNAVHRIVGATEDGKEFIARAEDALDSSKQYYTLLKQWQYHIEDSAYLLHVLTTVLDVSDKENMIKVGNAFIDCFKGAVTRDKAMLLKRLINSSESKGFRLFLDSASRIGELMNNANWVAERLSSIIFEERIAPFFAKKQATLNWSEISANLKTSYPTISPKLVELSEREFRYRILVAIRAEILKNSAVLAETDLRKIAKQLTNRFPGYDCNQLLLQEEVYYYAEKKAWRACTNSAYLLVKRYGDQIGDRDINNISWNFIFMHTADPKILAEAAKWMKHSIDKDSNRVVSMDTYANLLYKLGRRDEAIVWENKAIDIAVKNHTNAGDLMDFKSNLAKMEDGKQTWENNTSTSQN